MKSILILTRWRHVLHPSLLKLKHLTSKLIPLLPSDIPLFILDIPGYGRSAPLPSPISHDKRSTGISILTTLYSLLSQSPSWPSSPLIPIILIDHDRGARICHRLAVDFSSPPPNFGFNNIFRLKGTILLDIVPTLVQWQSMSDSRVSMGTFHRSFLANVEIATAMIEAQGGDNWYVLL
jgi:pimeloyl-ACP methyl ester carboxylesterase